MVDTVSRENLIKNVFNVIEEHKGTDTVVLNISNHCSWSDFLLITTASSGTHLKSLYRHIRNWLNDQHIETLSGHQRAADDTWTLIDCGFLVINIMDKEKREFYELEKLWHMGEVIYSSKSS